MKNKSNAACLLGVLVFLAAAASAQTNTATSESGNQSGLFSMDVSPEAPAVSEINGKLDYSGGDMDSHTGDNISGSLSFPVGHQFGFQADALYSRISDSDFYGAAGHFFWRKPDTGLLGVTGGYLYRSGVDTYQVGAEGEYYLGRFTLGAFAGFGSISYANPAPFIDTNPNRFIGRVSLDYYVLDNLRVGVAYLSAFEDNLVKGDIEYQTPIRGLALTAEGGGGDNGYHYWMLGVRYYFGGNKTLRDRQREDDPPGLMPQILQGLGLYGEEYAHKADAYIAANSGNSGAGSGSGVVVYMNPTGNYGNGATIIEVNRTSGFVPPPGFIMIPAPSLSTAPTPLQGSTGITIGSGSTITPPSGGPGYVGAY